MGQALCAQEIKVLSLDSCLKAAQAHNATIQSSKLDIEAADYVRREVMAKHFYESRFKRPKVRPYKTNNYYAAVMRQYQVEKEVERIVCNREKDSGSRSQAVRKEKEGA